MRPPNPAVPLLLWAGLCAAQPTVAPSPEEVGSVRGGDLGNYNVTNRWEVGYRYHSVGGNLGKYRSDVNFGNGVRLLSGDLAVFSRDGHGGLFDELTLSTQGLGGDPYQFSSLRIEKNTLYSYNLTWRENQYFNPGVTIAGGRHGIDTTRRWQDHNLTLLPKAPVRLLLGYGRNAQDGPALTTFNLFGSQGEEFPLFSDVRRERNEYRLGGELRLAGVRLTVIRGWENFKEDTPVALVSPIQGEGPDLNALSRVEPYHGNNPNWSVSLYAEPARRVAVSGRFSYVGGGRAFVVDETYSAVRFGATQNRQFIAFGTGRRPVATCNATVTFFPTSRLTVTNHTAVYNVRMEGDSVFREFNNATQLSGQVFFEALGLRTLVNATDADYRLAGWISAYGGYHYSNRRVRSRELLRIDDFESDVAAEQTNRIHSGVTGIRLQPARPLTISLEGEIGRANRPFFPISERNYHVLGARAVYKTRTVRLSAAAHANYNTNSVSLSARSSRARNVQLDASWTPNTWFAVDAAYSKLELETLSGLAYFVRFQLVEGDRSIYMSNIHSGHLGVRFGLIPRTELFAGFSRVQDTGDGRGLAETPPASAPPGSGLPAFRAVQTFPLTYQAPQARVSVAIRDNLRWNFGYQFYHYREDFSALQNYRAHTGYTSVLWSF